MTISYLLNNQTWAFGLYLEEKYKQLDENHCMNVVSDKNNQYENWMKKFSYDNELIENYLVTNNMTLEKFKLLLNSDNYTYNFQHTDWHKELVKIFIDEKEYNLDKYITSTSDEIPFYDFYKPFFNYTIHKLENDLPDVDWINKTRVIGVVLQVIVDTIFQLSGKTLIYELNNSRINNDLKGNTSKERYMDFCSKKIGNNYDIAYFLTNYPVLGRLIAENLLKISKNITLVIKRLINDKKEIEKFLNIDIKNLEAIDFMGDSHNDGNAVLCLTFDTERIMYKPRNLDVDIAFSTLLNWFNNNGVQNQFKIAKTLNKDSYGWQEFINQDECSKLEDINNFFQRQGQYIALLYATNATDMHMENIVSCGEHPFLIDLESLFHNIPFLNRQNEFDAKNAREKTSIMLNESVIKTSMLPTLDPISLYNSDLSGLAGDTVQLMNTNHLHNKNTDKMQIKRGKIEAERHNHLPKLNGKVITPKEYNLDVKAGFFNVYNMILEKRNEFIKLLDEFEGCRVRTIIRPTISYFSLIQASSHPRFLKNGLDREKLFVMMWLTTRGEPKRNSSAKIECYDLLRGDVPFFQAKIGETSLYHYKTENPMKNAFDIDILTLTKRKVRDMCLNDLETQWEFIERTVQTKYLLEATQHMENQSISISPDSLENNFITRDNNEILQEIIRIADYIKSIAIYGDEGKSVSWISMGMDGDEKLIYKPTEMGLYNGVTGIGYFYLYLSKETNNKEYLDIANMCINTAWDMVNNDIDRNISVFTGYGSLLHILFHRAMLFDYELINNDYKRLINILDKMVEEDDRFDIVSGCAGTLITCLDIYEAYQNEDSLNLAKKCGDRILSNSLNMDVGIAWETSSINKAPLSGIAHGNAGICLSLIKLYSVTKEEKYREACIRGLEYENSLYISEVNNWKDLRFTYSDDIENDPSMYWCNGAPGIGIARIGMSKHLDSEKISADVSKSIEKTITSGFQEISYSLCHGDLGNLELILLGADHYNDVKLNEYASKMINRIFNEVERLNGHWKCGIPGRQQIPGLMLGLSGIGYQLLRYINRSLPSILMLEAPNKVTVQNQNITEEGYHV